MKRIGLVLKGPFSYSLTFIASEIKVWQMLGYEVIVFSDHDQRKIKEEQLPIPVVKGLPRSISKAADLKDMFGGSIKLLFFGLKASLKLMALEEAQETPILERLKKLYLLSHILSYRGKLDVLHFAFGHAALGKELAAQSIGSRMSVSFRGADIGILPLKDPSIYRNVWLFADKIHVISEDLKQKVIDLCGAIHAQKVVKIYQTLDWEKLEKVSSERENRTLRILTVARLHWKKGIEYALQAIKQLQEWGVECHYTIIGSGPHEQAIRFTIMDLGLEQSVTLKGALSYEQVLQQMSGSHLYIQSSVQEGFCNAVLEAQGMGMLTVASNAEGIPENIIDGSTGWVVNKRSPAELADKIREILQLPEKEKDRIRFNARERIRKEFFLTRYKSDWRVFFSDNHAVSTPPRSGH